MATIGNHAYVLKCRLAVASLRKVDDPLRLAHKVRHLGDAYYYAGRWSLAEPCYLEALSIYRRHENRQPLDLANAIRSFAVLRMRLAQPQRRNFCGRKRTIFMYPSTCPQASLRALPRSASWPN